jgi:hypothetical protein
MPYGEKNVPMWRALGKYGEIGRFAHKPGTKKS